MSDFLFTRNEQSVGQMAKSLKNLMPDFKYDKIKEYSGSWGALAVSLGPYNGFEPYEDEVYICVVIGGPILYWRDNYFLTDLQQYANATCSILQRWKSKSADWSEDLSGPFVVFIINKNTKDLFCYTDLMMFIPVYKYLLGEELVLGTHIDTVSKEAKLLGLMDEVSVADFILHSYVTYPYTVYKNIFQLSPATEHYYQFKNNSYSEQLKEYWLPLEKNSYKSIDEAAAALRTGLISYIERITEQMTEVGQFISAGEDSRSIAGLLPNKLIRSAHIYVDSENREFKLAKRVSDTYKCDFNYVLREPSHYLDMLPEASKLVGSGQQYIHAHTLGLAKKSGVDQYLAVFGGYGSDSLLKALHRYKIKNYSRFSFLPELALPNETRTLPIKSSFIKNDILLEIDNRRKKHMNYIKNLRPTSCHEWFMLWPYSMRDAMPNLSVNRRLFPSYEIYTSKDVVKISAAVPTKWKINRKLFRKAVKPALKASKWIQHADGRLPYYPWYVNSFIQLPRWSRQMFNRLFKSKVNDGPWANWGQVLNNSEWNNIVENYGKNINEFGFFEEKSNLDDLFFSNELTYPQKINLIQTLYLKGSLNPNTDL